jgi:hypothetical protein
MGLGDKIGNVAEESGGKVKEATGKATDHRAWKPRVRPIRHRQASSKPARRQKMP